MALAGKVAIITGASRGIGADIARHLGERFYSAFKAALNRFTEQLARDPQFDGSGISANVLSPMGRVKTPGNIYAGQDHGDPLEFEVAKAMARATAWICEQPPDFTGHVLRDEQLCEAQGR